MNSYLKINNPMRKSIFIIAILFILNLNYSFSIDLSQAINVKGNFQVDAQSYQKDSIIEAENVPEKIRSNGYLNLICNIKDFEVGLRYEAYLPPILGIDPRYKGNGIPFRYFTFTSDFIDVTAGNFYEQFGSGLIFRAYEERQLGFDNAMDGLKVKLRPVSGIDITAVIGKQRSFWNTGDGIVRGADITFNINNIFQEFLPKNLDVKLGASVVSKYQADLQSKYKLPENVLAYSTRLAITSDWFQLDGEFAYKYNDPQATNEFNFNPGTAVILNASLFGTGIGFTLNMHRIDNMDFRSDRASRGNILNINYIPPLTKQHAYRLATIYPYATQYNGEIGIQADFTYTFDKESFLGGKYPTTINLNYSRVHSIDTTHIDEYTYKSHFFSIGKNLYFQDINFEIEKKWFSDLLTHFAYINIIYNKDILEHEGIPDFGKVYANIIALDFTYKLSKKDAIKLEFQHLWWSQDSLVKVPNNQNGNWLYLLAEYTISPSWFFTIWDEYNYGNQDPERQIHYISGSTAFVLGTTRISLGYGRQRGGTICIGGICRQVPSSNGFFLSISSSF